VKRHAEGTRLVLRKAVSGDGAAFGAYQVASAPSEEGTKEPVVDNKQAVVAPLVGIFHHWVKPRGKALVAVGDRVKLGQLIGAIQSLNVIYEVETTVAGRVAEVLVQDGQPVEYGQPLMMIESAEEA
jgi:biotin carboxyl carrier protein